MKKKSASAFSPGGISSFFEICDTGQDGKPLSKLEEIGARGGGFVINRGVHTCVEATEKKKSNVQVFINGKLAPEAETSRSVANSLLAETKGEYGITISHTVAIPIGAGFGTSAGGAMGTALALSKVLGLRLTYNQLGRIAHGAEIKCKTGLGTVGPIMLGGCILTVEAGAPGIGVVDRIPLSEEYSVVAGFLGPTSTKHILASAERRRGVNKWGRITLESILAEPSVENFLACCLKFAEVTGFMTEGVKRLANLAIGAGAVGAAQNMVGEAVHALVLDENAGRVAEAFKKLLPKDRIILAKIDFQGARLIS
ncbi:MAG TPA: hypothetical protein VF893_02695, partial [Candidatus Bathyarchaeia archaeon]